MDGKAPNNVWSHLLEAGGGVNLTTLFSARLNSSQFAHLTVFFPPKELILLMFHEDTSLPGDL